MSPAKEFGEALDAVAAEGESWIMGIDSERVGYDSDGKGIYQQRGVCHNCHWRGPWHPAESYPTSSIGREDLGAHELSHPQDGGARS